MAYSFPPVTDEMVNEGYADFARRFIPILDEYQKLGVRFALEVHPTEIAFDTYSARKALEAIRLSVLITIRAIGGIREWIM